MNLLRNIQIIPSTKTCVCPAGTTMYGPAVDISDCDGVLFIAVGGTDWAGKGAGKGLLSAQCSSSTGGAWSHYGSTIAVPAMSATTGQCRAAALDFYRPVLDVPSSNITRKYARAALGNATELTMFVSIKYGLRNPGATAWYSSSVRVEAGTVVNATKNT